jgi:uncharacterized protein YxeA
MKKILFSLLLVLVLVSVAGAACTGAVTNLAKQLLLQGYPSPTTWKMAFFQNAATYDSTSTYYSATNEVTGTNYTAGGYTLSGFTVGNSTTTSWWDFTDVSQSTVTFNQASTCAIVYDATDHHTLCTASNTPYSCCTGNGTGCGDSGHASIMFVLSFASIQPSAGTLTVTWPAADASNAIVRLGN